MRSQNLGLYSYLLPAGGGACLEYFPVRKPPMSGVYVRTPSPSC